MSDLPAQRRDALGGTFLGTTGRPKSVQTQGKDQGLQKRRFNMKHKPWLDNNSTLPYVANLFLLSYVVANRQWILVDSFVEVKTFSLLIYPNVPVSKAAGVTYQASYWCRPSLWWSSGEAWDWRWSAFPLVCAGFSAAAASVPENQGKGERTDSRQLEKNSRVWICVTLRLFLCNFSPKANRLVK